ncbi:MAG: hypothetical protein AB7T06_11620 [Kofleriaceae bacterium]
MRTSLLLALSLAACGDDGSNPTIVDAMPDSPPPDMAPACTAPNMMCGATCLDVSTDEENCGSCGNPCNGGEACTANACACAPTNFIPDTLVGGQFDQLMDVGGGISIALNANIGDGINPFIVGYDAQTPIDADIDLSMVTLGNAPFVGAGYHFDLGTNTIDASFVATEGTLHIDVVCATHMEGTLTNATFRGITGGFTNPAIDPDGCMFTLPTVTFAMGADPCP